MLIPEWIDCISDDISFMFLAWLVHNHDTKWVTSGHSIPLPQTVSFDDCNKRIINRTDEQIKKSNHIFHSVGGLKARFQYRDWSRDLLPFGDIRD